MGSPSLRSPRYFTSRSFDGPVTLLLSPPALPRPKGHEADGHVYCAPPEGGGERAGRAGITLSFL